MTVCWYSLTDQMHWDSALRGKRGNVNPLGLYDLDRNIRPVGGAYKRLIQQWRNVLPTQSLCLTVPVVMPSDSGRSFAAEQRARAKEMIRAPATTPAVQED